MIQYEIKKIFSKPSSVIVLILIAGLLLLCIAQQSSDVVYVDKNGKDVYGMAAIAKKRTEKKKWEGSLTTRKLQTLIEQYQNLLKQKKYQYKGEPNNLNGKGYAKIQGAEDIISFIEKDTKNFNDYDETRMYTIKSKEVDGIYKRRISRLKTYLATEAKKKYTDSEKKYLVNQYEKQKTPFQYEYFDGWTSLVEGSMMLVQLMMLLISFLLAGVFSGEHQLKADAILFSTYHGRKKAIRSKLAAAFIITTVIYFVVVLLYTVTILGVFGIDGANCSNLIYDSQSMYSMTMFQKYLLVLFGSYVATLFCVFATLFVSAKTKSTAFAAVISFILLFGPIVIGNMVPTGVYGMLPDQLLQISSVLRHMILYSVGGIVIKQLPVLFVFYIVLVVLLVPVIYNTYRKAEVR